MVLTRLTISTPPRFNFWRTVFSHGWCALPPFSVDKKNQSLSRVIELSDGSIAVCTLRQRASKLSVLAATSDQLTSSQRSELRAQLSECLRLGDDLSDFYKEARRYPNYRWIPRLGAGRMLRAPTVFEDAVKMICTTNCNWSLTELMVRNLTQLLGRPADHGAFSFPSPGVVAGTTEEFLRSNVRAGYRSPYLLKLATDVAEGKLDLEGWRKSALSTTELYSQVKSVKGMGEYAAGNMLKLLGRYDYLGLDSWVRGKYSELHARGRRVSDAKINRHYAHLGTWRGLFFWLEMTRDWYDHKFPF